MLDVLLNSVCINSLIFPTIVPKAGTVISPILAMRKLRYRKLNNLPVIQLVNDGARI